MTLSWTGASRVGVTYRVFFSDSPIPDSGGSLSFQFAATTTTTINNLDSGLWYFRVFAVNDAGQSSLSSEVSATVR